MPALSFAEWLVVISSIISVFSASIYIRDTWRGKTKPNLVTWIMWTVAPLVGVGAALAAGASPWSQVRIFLSGFFPFIIFIIALRAKGYWKVSAFDVACGALSLAALVAWLLAHNPVLAVVFAVIGDTVAAIPTIRKGWTHPESEGSINWVLGLISFLIILPAIPVWNIENALFPLSLVAQNVILTVAAYRKKLF